MRVTVKQLRKLISESMHSGIDLGALRYGKKTNLAAGVSTMVDFMVLYLGENGPSKRVEVERAIAAFRGFGNVGPYGSKRPEHTRAHHLFGSEFGHVSRGFEDTERGGRGYVFGTMATTLWYRPTKGVYALNMNGYKRYAKILDTMNVTNKRE